MKRAPYLNNEYNDLTFLSRAENITCVIDV